MQQHFPIFTATPHGILVDGLPLAKSFSKDVSPQARCYVTLAEELLKQVKPEDWDNRMPHDAHNIPTLAKAQMLLALASPQPMETFHKYRENQARVPAGSPEGGQWIDKGGSANEANAADGERAGNVQQSLDTIRQEVQTKANGSIKPVSTIPDAKGQFINQVNIFIGGVGDNSRHHNVEYSDSVKRDSYGSNYYFVHDAENEINDFIESLPSNTAVNVIGHSKGGSTAASIATNPDNRGRINTLVTIDPALSHPSYDAIRASVKQWVNVNATGGQGSWGNIIAGIGNSWNNGPKGYADIFISANYPHTHFYNMMNARQENGPTPQEIINGKSK